MQYSITIQRKVIKMTFEITRSNGDVINYSFDPKHEKDAKKFYRLLVKQGKIASWRIV